MREQVLGRLIITGKAGEQPEPVPATRVIAVSQTTKLNLSSFAPLSTSYSRLSSSQFSRYSCLQQCLTSSFPGLRNIKTQTTGFSVDLRAPVITGLLRLDTDSAGISSNFYWPPTVARPFLLRRRHCPC
jgi:hypothetical protein